jgi:hypothetical protein
MSRSAITPALKAAIRQEANYRCGYCLAEEVLMGVSLAIDHIVPLAAGGTDEPVNLWAACRQCNELKNSRTTAEDPQTGELVPLFNPRTQRWSEHFAWDADTYFILGITAIGRATVEALQINRIIMVRARQRWTHLGWPPLAM